MLLEQTHPDVFIMIVCASACLPELSCFCFTHCEEQFDNEWPFVVIRQDNSQQSAFLLSPCCLPMWTFVAHRAASDTYRMDEPQLIWTNDETTMTTHNQPHNASVYVTNELIYCSDWPIPISTSHTDLCGWEESFGPFEQYAMHP